MFFRMPMLGAIGLLTLTGDIDQTNLHSTSFSGTLYLGHFTGMSCGSCINFTDISHYLPQKYHWH